MDGPPSVRCRLGRRLLAPQRHSPQPARPGVVAAQAQPVPVPLPAQATALTRQRLLNPEPQLPPPPVLSRAGDLTGDPNPQRSAALLRDYITACHTPQYNEYDYYVPPEAVYGTIPEEVRGTLFWIGPGLTQAYGTSVRHPSDADGMVCSLAFGDGGQIFFRNRYVRTSTFVTEQTLGRRVSRGLHDRGAPVTAGQPSLAQPPAANNGATAAAAAKRNDLQELGIPQGVSDAVGLVLAALAGPGPQQQQQRRPDEDDLSAPEGNGNGNGNSNGLRSRLDPMALLGLPPLPPLSSLFNPLDTSFRAPANASIVFWGGRLLAFSESGSLPIELNKLSLETVGPYDMAGAMGDIGRLVGGYKIAPAPPPPGRAPGGGAERAQRLVVLGAAQSGPDTLLRWAELAEDGSAAGPATTYRLPGASAQAVLDFWTTDSHYVVVQAPADFNPQRFVARASVGTASFMECFDWDAGRPSCIHLVPRPGPPPPPSAKEAPPPPVSRQAAAAAAAAAASASRARAGRGTSIVWPPKGPDAIVVDCPPLLPTAAVGAYLSADSSGRQLLVLDGLCQQGLGGTGAAALDNADPRDYRQQSKPELTRIAIDLATRTATARVLSQRTVGSATTAAAFTGRAASGTVGPLAPVGYGSSLAGGYHHLYATASATEAGPGWEPPQVLVKLAIPPNHGVPDFAAAAAAATTSAATAAAAAATSASAAAAPPPASAPPASRAAAAAAAIARRRGIGAEAWSPGDRVFLGPPVFVPRKDALPYGEPSAAAAGAAASAAAAAPPGGLPPLESEVEAAARAAAASTAVRRRRDEQEGWLLAVLHDAESMLAELVVLDAADVTRGPVAVLALPHHLSIARGVFFTRSYTGPGRAAPPGWKPRVAAAPSAPPAGAA